MVIMIDGTQLLIIMMSILCAATMNAITANEWSVLNSSGLVPRAVYGVDRVT